MIELPEPHHSALAFVAFRENKSPVESFYTEAQLKQLLRDFGEQIAKAVKNKTKPNEAALEVIRALIKEIDA